MDHESGQILRQWAKRVLLEKGWDQKAWARAAGVDASTVHRILSRTDYAPRFSTLERLCAVAGSRPEAKPARSAAWRSVPVMSLDRLRDSFAIHHIVVPSLGGEGEVLMNGSGARAFACTIVTGSLVGGGFHPGDLVICLPISERLPATWDLVLVDLTGAAALSVGRFDQRSIYHEPHGALDSSVVRLLGVVIQLIRIFPAS